MVLMLVIYQKLDLYRIRRSEEHLAHHIKALEIPLWITTQGEIEASVDGEDSHYGKDGGDTMPPMFEVFVKSLSPNPTDQNYTQLEFSTFRVPMGGQ